MGLNDHASAGRIIVTSACDSYLLAPAASFYTKLHCLVTCVVLLLLKFLSSWYEAKVQAFPPDYKQPNGMDGRKNPDSSQWTQHHDRQNLLNFSHNPPRWGGYRHKLPKSEETVHKRAKKSHQHTGECEAKLPKINSCLILQTIKPFFDAPLQSIGWKRWKWRPMHDRNSCQNDHYATHIPSLLAGDGTLL